MTDLLSTITARITSIGSTISGIRRSIDPAPPILASGDLPALWVFADTGTHNEEEIDENTTLTRRIFRVQVAVLTLSEGDPYTRESRCRPLLDSVLKKYRGVPSLRNLAFVRESRVIGDSGIVILPEYGSQYIGFEVRLQIDYFEHRSFESGE